MIPALLAVLLPAHAADACAEVTGVAESAQVAWISPVRARVRARGWMEVIELADLEAWAKENGKEPARLLQAAGVVGRKAKRASTVPWKVTIFDVGRNETCRPITGALPGSPVHDVAICTADQQHPARGARPGFTGCGYTRDTGTSKRGLDVLRIRWEDAARQGFCVMPLDRFLEGL